MSRYFSKIVLSNLRLTSRLSVWDTLSKGLVANGKSSTGNSYSTRAPGNLISTLKADGQLAKSLKTELDYEKKNPIDNVAINSLKKEWQVQHTPGSAEITLTKQIGKEEVRVILNINSNIEEDFDDEDLPTDEELKDMGDSDKPRNIGSIEEYPEEDQDEIDEEDDSASLFNQTDFRVIITKQGVTGASIYDCSASEGDFEVHRIKYVQSAALALDQSSEGEMQLFKAYDGPDFSTLDPDVQDSVYDYLEARGMPRDEFASQLSELAAIKEQEEYQNWLQNMHAFVSSK